MSKTLKAVRGMPDILPDTLMAIQKIEHCIRTLTQSYGYSEIRLPLLEMTELFKRSVGEETDIVGKEMYSFLDRNDESLTLRPEGTAGCMRAGIEHGLFHNRVQKLWYLGPMFRYERPQKGRYRQFHQWGVEVVGLPGYAIEAEVIQLGRRLWEMLGLDEYIQLQINSLGSNEDRARYREKLQAHFHRAKDQLSESELERLDRNPLRLLDSKNPALKALIDEAPVLHDDLSESSKAHFDALCQLLTDLGINYTHNPHLVRGLDYYQDTVFEWVTDKLGAQNAVAAGGRYDGLVEQLGGAENSAVGFAMGIERLAAMMPEETSNEADIMVYCLDEGLIDKVYPWLESLRQMIGDQLRLVVDHQMGSRKRQLKRVERSQAASIIMIDQEKWQMDQITVKMDGTINDIAKDQLSSWLQQALLQGA